MINVTQKHKESKEIIKQKNETNYLMNQKHEP